MDYRAVFEKYGRIKYISHLDLVRCMKRAFQRANLPIWYTEGFNQRIYINFPLPLSLGYEGSCEFMDFTLTEEVGFKKIRAKLNEVLPEGLKIIEVDFPKHKNKDIGFAEYQLDFKIENPNNLSERFNEFMSQEQILTEKRGKKKGKVCISTVDIKPVIDIISQSTEGNVFSIFFKLPSGSQTNFNPSLISDAFLKYIDNPDIIIRTERKKIICHNGEEFT